MVVQLHPRCVFPFGGDIFWGLQMQGQKAAFGEPFLASHTLIFAI